MKKSIICLLFGISLTVNTQAQEYNLFHDVDADGWLWFDTQEKIDKYVGVCDEENYKVDPNGKPIQMIYADIYPDYTETFVDVMWEGAGEGGEIAAAGFRTGAIVLAKASSLTGTNGGGFVVLMPSCSSYSICLSSEAGVYCRMMGSKNVNEKFTNYTNISAHTLFNQLCGAGIYTWTGIEELDNGYEDGTAIKLKGNSPIYAYFQNNRNQLVYIHGIRVTTPTQTSIQETTQESSRIFLEGNCVVLHEAAPIKVFNMCGTAVVSKFTDRLDLKGLPTGIYIVKAGERTRKVFVQ